MSSTAIPQLVFRKTNVAVGQDKIANTRDRVASGRPAASKPVPRSEQLVTSPPRSQNTSRFDERTVPLTLHVRPIVKDRIREIAKREALKNLDAPPSLSEVGGKYLERGLQSHMDMQYGALLEPMMKKILEKNQRQMINLFRWLLVRIAFDGNQTRTLVTNIFVRQEHISKKAKETILSKTAETAKSNIFGQSPQLMELVREFDQQLAADLAFT
jgi:hypothetical protein